MSKKIRNKKRTSGFTLIEVLIVIGIIAILAAVVLVAINPARQFALARNTQRTSNLTSLLNAIGQNSIDNRGVFTCAAGALPSTPTPLRSGAGGYDIRACLVPMYVSEIPADPLLSPFSLPTYDTGYTISYDASTTRITVSAPRAELAQTLSLTR
jgi:type IV pilus assembly protein PilA